MVKNAWLIILLIGLMSCASKPSAPEQPDIIVEAEKLLQQGVQSYSVNDYVGAVTAFKRALIQFQSVDEIDGVLNSYSNLAETALSLGQYEHVADYLKSGEPLIQYARTYDVRRWQLIQIGLDIKEKRYEAAEQRLTDLLPKQENSPDDIQISALVNRVHLAFSRDTEDDAQQWLNRLEHVLGKQTEVSQEYLARLHRFRAQLLTRQGAYKLAEVQLKLALGNYKTIARRVGIAATLEQLASVMMYEKRWGDAELYYLRALPVRIAMLDRWSAAHIFEQLIIVNEQLKKPDKVQLLRQWVAVMNDESMNNWQSIKDEQIFYWVE